MRDQLCPDASMCNSTHITFYKRAKEGISAPELRIQSQKLCEKENVPDASKG